MWSECTSAIRPNGIPWSHLMLHANINTSHHRSTLDTFEAVPIYIRHSFFVDVSLSEISVFVMCFGRFSFMFLQDLRVWTMDGNQYFDCSSFFVAYSCGGAYGGNATISSQLIDSFVRRLYNRSIILLQHWPSSIWLVMPFATRQGRP